MAWTISWPDTTPPAQKVTYNRELGSSPGWQPLVIKTIGAVK